ncbi:homoserine O-acetyltransferase MetA [Mangrovibacterium diazotrophicum]|uniref:Homoserine O-acetyltransferase n=1 Tax=Mangrovibacterium diazotrophicum TaxID=1261403 RepID=A0A419VYS4_9BACT|nr:homoserine O-succinyltransferase [Mangrovibacterium diazotrophicum]RKD88395.1 homoserine O-succinyltransferase [Mangrovibacterium diazotrophicum]
MPLNIPDKLPAIELLLQENIFVIDQTRAAQQDIRPLKIVILNLMPLKITTETDLLRVLSNSPLQIEIDFLKIKDHEHKHTSAEHMATFYKTFDQIKKQKFDGMIITGAPVEHLPFEEVTYWDEIREIMDWSLTNVTSSLFICWASQAALFHFYGIPKYALDKKMFGVFQHRISDRKIPIFRGFDDEYYVPHSRHTEVRAEDIEKVEGLDIISSSDVSGVNMVMARNGRQIFITGHAEYSRMTLDGEYKRDVSKNLPIEVPANYYPNDDPNEKPVLRWRSAADLLFTNWLNYYVYQETPYNLDDIK